MTPLLMFHLWKHSFSAAHRFALACLFLGITFDNGAYQATAKPKSGFHSREYPSFVDWKAACDKLPTNRSLGANWPDKELLPLKTFAKVEGALQAVFDGFKAGPMKNATRWVGEAPKSDEFFDTRRAYFLKPPIPFQPFAQKLELPPGAEIIFHGDFHGDIHSFIAVIDWLNQNDFMDGFRLVKPETHMVFLGDYTDRGRYGIEVIYTLLRLKLANPDRVFMARGNHEDLQMIANYGFLAECRTKYGQAFNPIQMARLYDFFPVVIYAGCNGSFIQCNHGGMEPGYLPGQLLNSKTTMAFQLLGQMKGGTFLTDHPELLQSALPATRAFLKTSIRDYTPLTPMAPVINGFMWNDFTVFQDESGLGYLAGRGFVYGRVGTRIVLNASQGDNTRVRAVFRAHQHSSALNPMMRRLTTCNGLFRHWQPDDSQALADADTITLRAKLDHNPLRNIPEGSVWTFNVSPDSVYGQGCRYNFDTFGILRVEEKFNNWKLRVVNLPIEL